MEQVTAGELVKRTGLAYTTLMNLNAQGKISGERTPNGRLLFNPSTVLDQIEKLGIKPRARKSDSAVSDAPASVSHDELMEEKEEEHPDAVVREKRKYTKRAKEEVVEESESVDTDLFYSQTIKKAHRAAQRAYKKFIEKILDGIEGDESCEKLELKLLRHYKSVDSMFRELSAK